MDIFFSGFYSKLVNGLFFGWVVGIDSFNGYLFQGCVSIFVVWELKVFVEVIFQRQFVFMLSEFKCFFNLYLVSLFFGYIFFSGILDCMQDMVLVVGCKQILVFFFFQIVVFLDEQKVFVFWEFGDMSDQY